MKNNLMKNKPFVLRMMAALLFPALATAAGFACEAAGFSISTIVILYLLAAVLWTIVMPGYIQGILSSLVSMLCFNYFFTPPRYTFSVSNPSDLITFALMCAASLITGFLMTGIMQVKSQNVIFYNFQRQLAGASDRQQILHLLCRTLEEKLNLPACSLTSAAKPAEGEWLDCWTLLPDSVGRDMPAVFVAAKRWKQLSASSQHVVETLTANAALAISRMNASKARELALEESARIEERNRLLQSVSHDIRTPLTSITLDAEQLQEENSQAKRQILCTDIIEQTNWLLTMSTNILQLSRLQAAESLSAASLECLPAEEVVSSALSLFEKTHPKISVETSIPDEPLFVPMDPILVQQALINLLENAARFTPKDRPLHLLVSQEGRCAVFSVINEGKTIQPENLDSLFEPFSGTDSRHRHYGLGLAVCKTIAEVHKGSLEACNTGIENGVRFSLRLPLSQSCSLNQESETEKGDLNYE